MGISGLLPLLKPIQVNKHLSEFSGQTLAVDAYVWLHRGVYSCAESIATGKNTTKYVDYAMHRIRLLRHHNIQPYVVFDGGPLPAKKGTEVERRQRREENRARANALAAQGKHSQAREYYVKCVDVTPQMAYQLIKALRAESVLYIVAPYEADAQLAYLERIGLVDGIITEDSDLLVFGCRTVLFKLDAVSSTVTSICRADFASVTTSPFEGTSVSFTGWSDVQFRSMAILSGCDYLDNIPGIGLKTAWSLLRKWKTVENVVRSLRLEGKKDVPRGYLAKFKLAEKCYLHQRVYDPIAEKLVHLTDVTGDWDEDDEVYVGQHIEDAVARTLAAGDIDPITLQPMEDINPHYVPLIYNSVDFTSAVVKQAHKDKGKSKAVAKPSGILNFFNPKPQSPRVAKDQIPHIGPDRSHMLVGRASGKRTLADIMDADVTSKKRRHENPATTQSRFFNKPPQDRGKASKDKQKSGTRFHSIADVDGKENKPILIEDDNKADTCLSMKAQGGVDHETDGIDFDEFSDCDAVSQEDGYISPSPSFPRYDTPDLSSPPRAPKDIKAQSRNEFDEFNLNVDPVSSPHAGVKMVYRRPNYSQPRSPLLGTERGPAHDMTTPIRLPVQEAGPDLRDFFADDLTSEIECFADDIVDTSLSTLTSTPPVTPVNAEELDGDVDTEDGAVSDSEIATMDAATVRTAVIANGWRRKWASDGRLTRRTASFPPAKQNTDTPNRRTPLLPNLQLRQRRGSPAPAPPNPIHNSAKYSHTKNRRKLLFLQPVVKVASGERHRVDDDKGCASDVDVICQEPHTDVPDGSVPPSQLKLARFRYP